MKKVISVLNSSLVIGAVLGVGTGWSAGRMPTGKLKLPTRISSAPIGLPAGQAAAAKKPAWKSREEYDAFQKMLAEKDSHQRISLADAFIAKYSNSDFKYQAYLLKMQSYQQLNDPANAMKAARAALEINPDNLAALNYLSFAFPFVFKVDAADKDAQLSQAAAEAKHGLEILQNTQRPANVAEEQFTTQVKQLRSNFNRALGFAALQQKDYASAITSLKAAAEDNPSDGYTFSFLGQAYLYSKPPDFDNSLWDLARSEALAKANNSPNAEALAKFYDQVYESRHGSNQGEQDIVTEAAASPTPPAGFKVAPPEAPKPTGDANVDNFNMNIAFPLKLGGDRAQKAWDLLKNQPLAMVGYVNSVKKGTDEGAYIIRVALDKTKAASTYDLELADNAQPKVSDLVPGDPVRFKGTISAYTAAPTFVLTLSSATINDDDLTAAADRAKAKAAPKPRTRRRARSTQ